ncbi:hypothetical protein ACFX12_006514 [Malus domestica]
MEVGPLVNPGRALWVGAYWWVQEVVLLIMGCCQAGRDWAAMVEEEKKEVLFFWSLSNLDRLDLRPRSKLKLEFMVMELKLFTILDQKK